MWYLNVVFNTLGDLTIGVLGRSQPWRAMLVASLVTAFVLLLIVRVVARPRPVYRAKGVLIACVMELHLFRHDPVVTFGACRRILIANLVYLRHLLRPLCWTLLPGLLILVQLNCWYSRRPLQPGESAVLEVALTDGTSVLNHSLSVKTSDALAVETPAMRVPSTNQLSWRLRALDDSDAWVGMTSNDVDIRQQVAVGDIFAKVAETRVRAGSWQALFHPADQPFDAASGIESITVRYPPQTLAIGWTQFNWIVVFLVLTIAFGALLKGPLKAPM